MKKVASLFINMPERTTSNPVRKYKLKDIVLTNHYITYSGVLYHADLECEA